MSNNGEEIGRYYFGVRITRDKVSRILNVYADEIRIENGDLLLFGHRRDEPPATFLYRAFARGTWQDVHSASCMDGSELGEDHDVDVATGKDLRFQHRG